MKDQLIKQYIDRITTNDVDRFARSYGINLTEDELAILYRTVKNDWRTIIYGNPRAILDNLKKTLEPFTYQKMEEIYIHFKDKFKDYL